MIKNRNRIPLAAALAILVAALVFLLFFTTREAASEERFDEISKGMTMPEVAAKLGEPDFKRTGSYGETVFFYGGLRRFRWCTMEVFFGGGDTVTAKFHDH